MEQIRQIIEASIETKQQILQNEALLQTVAAIVDASANAL